MILFFILLQSAGLAGLTANLLCWMMDVFRVGTDSGVGMASPVRFSGRIGTGGGMAGTASVAEAEATLVLLLLVGPAIGILATAAGPFCLAI